MRKTLLFLLATSAAGPALAADEPGDRGARREAARAERAEARDERRSERAERPQQSQRSESPAQDYSAGPSDGPTAREERREVFQQRMLERRPDRDLGGASTRPALEARVLERRSQEAGDGGGLRPAVEQRREARDSVREWRARERSVGNAPAELEQRRGAGVFQQPPERRLGRDSIGGRRAPIVSRLPREGTQPPAPAAARPSSLTARHWNGNWRSDHRYDWRKHRNRHRSLFQFGFYYDPFGWGYRSYSIGWRMWPSYYRSSYWLNDPGMYRLPYAPPGTRWIRYYDDALLVDTWDGQVVDVIYDFFW